MLLLLITDLFGEIHYVGRLREGVVLWSQDVFVQVLLDRRRCCCRRLPVKVVAIVEHEEVAVVVLDPELIGTGVVVVADVELFVDVVFVVAVVVVLARARWCRW